MHLLAQGGSKRDVKGVQYLPHTVTNLFIFVHEFFVPRFPFFESLFDGQRGREHNHTLRARDDSEHKQGTMFFLL